MLYSCVYLKYIFFYKRPFFRLPITPTLFSDSPRHLPTILSLPALAALPRRHQLPVLSHHLPHGLPVAAAGHPCHGAQPGPPLEVGEAMVVHGLDSRLASQDARHINILQGKQGGGPAGHVQG